MDQIFPGYTGFVQENGNDFSLRKKKKEKKKKQPQHAMNYFDQSATIAETVSNALETTVCLLREMRKIIPIPHHCDI